VGRRPTSLGHVIEARRLAQMVSSPAGLLTHCRPSHPRHFRNVRRFLIRTRYEERQMRKRAVSILSIVTSRIVAVMALTTLQAVALLAADDCLTKPNLRAAQGGHWYYHLDVAKNRKCWFLRRQGVDDLQAVSPQPQPQSPADTVPQSRSSSWFSSLVLAFAPASEPGQRLPMRSENRSAQPSPPDALRRDEFSPKEQPQIARHNSARKQPAKPHERSGARSSEKQVLDERNAAPDQASSDALFREFVLWNERQSTVDTTLHQTDRDALFREFLLWNERQRSAKPP